MVNQIPVVLLEGTGGCCDLFAKCFHLFNEYRPRSRSIHQRNEELKTKIYEKLQFIHDEMKNYPLEMEYFQLIYQCIEQQPIFLNFIDFKNHSHMERDLDLAILRALLNGNQTIDLLSKEL